MTRVVITGVGAIHPFGRGVDSLWEGVLGRTSAVSLIDRFDASSYPMPFAAQIPEAYRRGLPQPGADWAGRYALAALDDALADAGLAAAPPFERLRCAVYFGFETTNGEFDLVARALACGAEGGRVCAERLWDAVQSDAAPGLEGLLHERFIRGALERLGTVESVAIIGAACASGAEAIGAGLRAIRSGRAEVAVVGASDAKINPIGFGLATQLGMLSRRVHDPDTASRPFDRTRDGIVLAEGAAVLVLEREADAGERGARIHARLSGAASSCDAFRLTDPAADGASAAAAIRGALRDAGVARVDYVNAHGTSTVMNDRAEVAALRRAFEDAPLPVISSTKGATGHMMAAAGAVEAVICVRALAEQMIPPTLHYRDRDPRCDVDVTPNDPRPAELRTILSNSFGFGGQNACIVLEHAGSWLTQPNGEASI